jgi:hypothetical protein
VALLVAQAVLVVEEMVAVLADVLVLYLMVLLI